MDREEMLNEIIEIQYELDKVKKKLNNLVSYSTRNKEIHTELGCSTSILLKSIHEIDETIEIEKWVLMN